MSDSWTLRSKADFVVHQTALLIVHIPQPSTYHSLFALILHRVRLASRHLIRKNCYDEHAIRFAESSFCPHGPAHVTHSVKDYLASAIISLRNEKGDVILRGFFFSESSLINQARPGVASSGPLASGMYREPKTWRRSLGRGR